MQMVPKSRFEGSFVVQNAFSGVMQNKIEIYEFLKKLFGLNLRTSYGGYSS